MSERSLPTQTEWPTLAILVACYGLWVLAVFWAAGVWLPLGIGLAALAIALHSSLTHEVLHGHPFRNALLNEALVFVCPGLFVPYRRFRDLHLAHHHDEVLTDPYDDPESNYLDPAVWARLPRWGRAVLRVNNTLAGRMVLGPAIGIWCLLRDDSRAIRAGDPGVLLAWVLHALGVVPVVVLVALSPMPFWAYLVAAYGGMSILKIRTFLEHQAHERASGRTVVIEDCGPLALIFLNNNLHVVHHMHPRAPWYRLPRLFDQNRDTYLRRNGGYYYRSYAEVFARHFLTAKDPVPHPLSQGKGREPTP
ncbi:fatty acid desaturase [Roseovarius amoyensis]|uniref:fatty acid desaturase n=1 Tax=Roseovarius amoyensis TaxID=2211448 RepID=UPI000DBE9FDF|nr:fatty acid desaturase [Roseovarius amoyensis]